jgi:acyl-coenzyme A synthetase/AMP-(fatty) acid ligase
VFRTSGTTGTAKRVAMSHQDAGARAARRLRSLDMPHPLRTLSRVRPRASYGFQICLGTLWAGGTMVESGELKEVANVIERQRVTWLVTPPGVLAPLIDAMPPRSTPLTSLALLEVSGSRLTKGLASLAAERICENVNVLYGSTETGIVAGGRFTDMAGVPDAVGHLVPGVEVEAVDDAGTPVPRDTDGFLRVRGDGCARGYLDDTGPSRAFRDGWFYSGDMGRVVDGILVLRGRADERINVGGAKSSPEALETVVLEMPGILDAAAFSLASPTGLDRVGMALVTGPSFDFEAFKAACHQRLGIFSPEIVLRVGAIPRNENGKVLRQALAQLARSQAPRAVPAPGNPRA